MEIDKPDDVKALHSEFEIDFIKQEPCKYVETSEWYDEESNKNIKQENVENNCSNYENNEILLNIKTEELENINHEEKDPLAIVERESDFRGIREVILDDDSDEELNDSIVPDSEEDATPEEVNVRFRSRSPGESNSIDFTPPYVGINKTAAPNIDANSSPFSIFTLFFDEVIRLLFLETNRYYYQYCTSRVVPGPSVEPFDIKFEEIYKFLALIIQMGHDQRDTIKDYWCKDEQYYTPFYRNTMARDRFLHILRFLHFTDNNNAPNREDPDYDRLWKIRNLFDTLNHKFGVLYYPTEHIAVDEIIVLFKGSVIFRQYIPKKVKRFGIKMYKLNDSLGYTYDMTVCSGKQKESANETILQLVRRVEGVGHKLFMGNNFSSSLIFDELLARKIYSYRYKRRGIPQGITSKLKKGDISLTNTPSSPVKSNFVDEIHKVIKPRVIDDYYKHKGYVDKAYKMANSYGVAREAWKWSKKLFFHLLDLTILNAYLLHKSVGGNMSHKKFRETLVRNLIIEAQGINMKSTGRPSLASTQLSRLEAKHSQHWPSKCNTRRCRVCSKKNKYARTSYCCKKCDVGLCVVNCFEKWHTCAKF